MSNKFYAGLSVAAVCLMLLTGCGREKAQVSSEPVTETVEETTMDTSKTNELAQDTALSNPATVYCLQEGGEFVMKKTLDGATEGFCILPNNITCEVWAHYQGNCPTKQPTVKENEAEKETEERLSPKEEGFEDAAPSTLEQDGQNQGDSSQKPADETKDGESTDIKDENDLELSVEVGEDPGELVSSWKTNGLKAPEGFYVMLSGDNNIEYPTKYTHELKNSQSRSFVWTGLTPQKTYYFRVCIIEKGDCRHYSPVISGTVQ